RLPPPRQGPPPRLRWPEPPTARHRRARLSRALGDARLLRLAVSASAGLLGSGQMEGLRRARGRHRAGEGGDRRRRSGGRLLHVGAAGADPALPQEPALTERGSLSLPARRRDGARITAPSWTPASCCSSSVRIWRSAATWCSPI